MAEIVNPKGFIEARIKYKNTDVVDILRFNNQVLNKGKEFLASCLLESPKSLWVANILFGDGGIIEGQPKEVAPTQNKLNGVVRVRKSVIAQIDPDLPSQAIFTAVLSEEEGNGFALSEMGLELNNEVLFSLSTFSDLNKTDQMEISWLWFINIV